MEAKMFELRKRRARYEQEMSVHAAELSALSLQLESTDSIIAKRKSVLVQQGEMLKRYEKDISAKMSEMSGVSAELKEAKEIADRMYEQSASKRKKASQSRLDEERASLDARRKEREDLMVRIAQMQKESEMFGIQARELADNAGKRKSLIANLKEELAELGKRRSAVAKAKSELEDRIRKSGEQNKKAYEQLQSFQDAVNKLVSERSLLSSELDRAESQLGEKRLLRNQIETRISDYEAEVAAYGKETFADGKAEDMDKEIAVLSSKIADLGNVNLKAPESYELKKRDVELANERITTLNGERESILKMIEEIDSKKTKVFLDTLEQVNKNFVRLYGAILPGKASMELSDMKDIFNSGLYIRISSLRNKKTKIGEANPDQGAAQTYMKNMDSLSGGQKSMILLVLLFAIHTYKPSPLYIFDEIDSALDKENSKKLSQLIKMLSKSSQFVVVSHNDTLISDADIAIGVTSVNDESRAVGIEVSSILNDRKPNPGSGQPKLENLSAEMEIKSRSAKGADSGA
jgi:chromosome segregation ATPase